MSILLCYFTQSGIAHRRDFIIFANHLKLKAMNISYNWIKDYISISENIDSLSKVLTQIGLEVGAITEFDSIKGGLEGFVIGEVVTCEKHPNADKLNITTVDIGKDENLNIVCGAPNVAAGQKVVVATVGTTLYTSEGSFQIKKAKIRGEVSQGMICAEDEMGIGTSHDGIMVLPIDTKVGLPAREYFKIEKDTVFEIDLTPNRVDAASHIGVTRDLAAYYKKEYKLPLVEINAANKGFDVEIQVENTDACPRYMGICMEDIKVCESPDWLQNRLKAIGLNPINNIVDITNYVLHETGHPLHAFDGDKIIGNKVIVKTLEKDTKFVTLDEIERELSEEDLMICNNELPMCIGGVFGGIDSGISEKTTKLFIESAYFNPTWIRKTAKRHTLSTDASFRFERGVDINMAPYALKRAVKMIEELGYGKVSSEIKDIYPNEILPNIVCFNYENCQRLIGKDIGKENIKDILKALEIKIIEENDENLKLEIPTYRVDVYREADVIEDILRIFGYNNIEIPEKISLSINRTQKPDNEQITNMVSDMFVSQGFNEIICNSLISERYFNENNLHVKLHNPLSKDLSIMRPNMIFGGLESIEYNTNRKNNDLKFFEFGRVYSANSKIDISNIDRYNENKMLAIWICGKKNQLNWNLKANNTDFFYIKAHINNVFTRLGIDLNKIDFVIESDEVFSISQQYMFNNKVLLKSGIVSKSIISKFDISQEVFYAEINWDLLLELLNTKKIKYEPVSKFPAVTRDLALLIDKNITYKQLYNIANKIIGKNLTKVNLFDVYDGKNIEQGKVSYALSYVLEDKSKTMTDKQIDKIMKKLIFEYEKIGAKVR